MEQVIEVVVALLTIFCAWKWSSDRQQLTLIREQRGQQEKFCEKLQEECQKLKIDLTEKEVQIAYERSSANEKLALLKEAHRSLTESFKAISADALKHNNSSFLELASTKMEQMQITSSGELQRRQELFDGLVVPIRQALEKMDTKLTELDKSRIETQMTLKEQVNGLLQAQTRCHQETSQLSRALRSPHVRGRWGEIQLKRIAEMAGMVEMCDFLLQETVVQGDVRRRPDMIVRMPGDRHIVVDSKTPLHAYLEAIELDDEQEKNAKLKEHARHFRSHIDELSKKSYWDQFQQAPEFVVLFIPGEMFFSAALQQDPTLIERGVERKVILATPTTLIALLHSVAHGWTQERAIRNTEQVTAAGKQLYERLSTFVDHLAVMRKGLEQAVKAYNQGIGSFENRVMVTARKFQEFGVSSGQEITTLESIESSCRQLTPTGTD